MQVAEEESNWKKWYYGHKLEWWTAAESYRFFGGEMLLLYRQTLLQQLPKSIFARDTPSRGFRRQTNKKKKAAAKEKQGLPPRTYKWQLTNSKRCLPPSSFLPLHIANCLFLQEFQRKNDLWPSLKSFASLFFAGSVKAI